MNGNRNQDYFFIVLSFEGLGYSKTTFTLDNDQKERKTNVRPHPSSGQIASPFVNTV